MFRFLFFAYTHSTDKTADFLSVDKALIHDLADYVGS